MFEINVDFDAIRERLIDGIFAAAGHVAGFADTVIDSIEYGVESLNEAGE